MDSEGAYDLLNVEETVFSNNINFVIEQIFSSRPRNGADEHVLWHRRKMIEKRLSQILNAKSQNVCIDGPTGSGKTSLALTVLNRNEQPFVWVPITQDMGWPDFCEALAVEIHRINSNVHKASAKRKPQINISINTSDPMSGAELVAPWSLFKRITLQADINDVSLPELRKAAKDWKILDVHEVLRSNELCLLIDDFEKSSDELLRKIADLCKHLTFSSSPKCIIIGTGQTFARLFSSDESLDGRLAEITVASLGSQMEVWNYINDGFGKLGFTTPRDKFSTKLINREETDKLRIALYEAADGMPKYINEIALNICNKILSDENEKEVTRNISSTIMLEQCNKMINENLSRYSKNIRNAEKELRSGVELRLVLKTIFQVGANGVHSVDSIIEHIQKFEDKHFDYDRFLSGFEALQRLNLYVQTDKSGEVVFAKDPLFSHVLGLVCKDPKRFNKDPATFGLFGQRSLPLLLN